MTKPMPAIFFGHGNPMNALSKNTYTDGWNAIGKQLPRRKPSLLGTHGRSHKQAYNAQAGRRS